jgi:hypothetical protein
MSQDQRLFEAQKQEFDQHTELFREKLTRMYLRPTAEGELSFDERIHAVWDEWDVSRRSAFIQKAFEQ